MKCGELCQLYAPMFFVPGYVNGVMINPASIRAYGFMHHVSKAVLTSVALTVISGAALIFTAKQSTANRAFKAGFAGFGTLAAVIVLCAAAKLYYNIRTERQRPTTETND